MRAVAISLLCLVVACGSKRREDKHDDHHDDHDDHAGSQAAGSGAKGEPDLIRIAKDMLRDLRVTTSIARARTAGETVSALGELHVNEDAYAEVASPVTARVVRILVKPGDTVAAGQVLAQLSSPELGESRAGIEAARARLDVAKAAAERKRQLAADRLIPEREKLDAESALVEAQAAYNVAASGLRKYGGATGDNMLAIKSPIAGTVIDRTVLMGQLADPSKTLFRIGDLSTLWLIAHVFERDAVRVQVGAEASATLAALPGKSSSAVIRTIGREVDAASRTIAIRLDVPNPDGTLRPGMSASVAIPLGESGVAPVIVVPAAAVQRVGAAWAVFIPHGDDAFEVRAIGRGRDLAGDVEVLSGLKPGESMVVDGAFLLKAEADKARGGGGGHDH
jgi:cobalt-zinc-cadmium efflux system membrane fusion protein